MVSKKLIRKKVLEALKMAEGYGKPGNMVREMVAELCGEDPGLQDMRDAMETLHTGELIRSERDEDGIVIWFITPAGIAKLNTL